MTVTLGERSVVLAARELAKLETKRVRLKQKFADQIIMIDQEIVAARQALRTFTDGGRELVPLEPPTTTGVTGTSSALFVGAGRSER